LKSDETVPMERNKQKESKSIKSMQKNEILVCILEANEEKSGTDPRIRIRRVPYENVMGPEHWHYVIRFPNMTKRWQALFHNNSSTKQF
jgi:hypothetical protein